ncbi:MAG TPA: 3-phosphoshikimate 1-carboxyvinyltransferase [Acidimicrobiia bacterium]|nr:3-phosphoshikimate 1-carboxyvinyltransferase [Acidimicrobiia bacterium]
MNAEIIIAGPRPLRGTLRVPGDKGISHRALLAAALASGSSTVRGLADGDDVRRTRVALERLGVRLRVSESADAGSGAVNVQSTGVSGLREPDGVIDCGNSGTTMRTLSGLGAGRPFLTVLTGDASLLSRPMGRVVHPLRALGARVDGRADGELAPLVIRGGNLTGRRCELDVATAQVKTALVLAGLQADGITEVVEPAPSRDHTERMLAAVGAPVTRVDDRITRVERGAPDPFELDVPGDPSSAALFAVAACITPDSEIVIEDLCLNPSRLGFVEVLRRMGARIHAEQTEERLGEPVGRLVVEASALAGTPIAPDEGMIDEIPILAVAAAFADGVTEIRGLAELRVKESDRINTIQQELTQMGVDVEAHRDALTIRGGAPRPTLFKSHGDHRIALAAAVAANAMAGESIVRGWHAVAVSYPRFTDDLRVLAGENGS